MRFNPFVTHRWLTHFVFALLLLALLLSAQLGELKAWPNIAWLDVVGEGGIVLMTLSWIITLLISRPPSKVTTLLVTGLGIFMFSASLDLMDEWLKQPDGHWLSWIESLPAPVGMLLTSIGLFYWHFEQRTLNLQLHRREASNRDHQQVCPITSLYRASHLDALLKQKQTQSGCLGLIDIADFANINSQIGLADADLLLRDVSELLLINTRHQDVVMRYSGDCFLILLEDVNTQQAKAMLNKMCATLAHCQFYTSTRNEPIKLHAHNAVIELGQHSSSQALLSSLLKNSECNKQQGLAGVSIP